MKIVLIFIFNILLIYLLNKIFIKKNLLIDKKIIVHKNFTSKDLVPISGGFVILSNLFFFNINYLSNIFFIGIFYIGILSDLLIIQKPLKKFFFQTLIVLTFLFFLNISIFSTKIFFIDFLIKYKLLAFLFTAFCLLILINGSNFLDGVNTLVCGYYMLVIIVILYLGYSNKINYDFENFIYLLISLTVIFIFNFFSKTYLGDSGTFLLSFVVGYQLIDLYNINLTGPKYISPVFILLLLWYPAFENLFSIIRKFLSKKNPSDPDNLHLHHLLFSYFNKKFKNYSMNSFTGMIINLYNFLIFLIGINLYNNTNILIILLILNIFIYSVLYIIFLEKFFIKV
jgi:UDP-N-acetylmuramyl pentapeptide phosphotransferase/UDP-N-acetylglucosamine-1-phosphate transferase